MKNHIADITIAAEALVGMNTSLTNLKTDINVIGVQLDETQRKHSSKMGTPNETSSREMPEFAQQRPELMPAGISVSALERDMVARDQLMPILFQLEALTRTVRDTHIALGVDLYKGTRALYKAAKPLAEINGVTDIIDRIGERFAGQGRKATQATEAPTERSES